jgi:hypothetical protein
MLWTSKKSVDQQMADHRNNQQSTKARDTGARIVLVNEGQSLLAKEVMTHCAAMHSFGFAIVSDSL